MVFPLLVPAAIFALWAIPKVVDSKKHSNRKGKSRK